MNRLGVIVPAPTRLHQTRRITARRRTSLSARTSGRGGRCARLPGFTCQGGSHVRPVHGARKRQSRTRCGSGHGTPGHRDCTGASRHAPDLKWQELPGQEIRVVAPFSGSFPGFTMSVVANWRLRTTVVRKSSSSSALRRIPPKTLRRFWLSTPKSTAIFR
jgi:hypothetical protein